MTRRKRVVAVGVGVGIACLLLLGLSLAISAPPYIPVDRQEVRERRTELTEDQVAVS